MPDKKLYTAHTRSGGKCEHGSDTDERKCPKMCTNSKQ